MSARFEAAAKAHYQSSPHSETWEQADSEARQWFLGRIAEGLAASDAVMFSEAAIERAARKLRQRVPELIPPEAMDHVHAVIAALREEA